MIPIIYFIIGGLICLIGIWNDKNLGWYRIVDFAVIAIVCIVFWPIILIANHSRIYDWARNQLRKLE